MYIISYLHFLQIEYLPLFTFSKFEFESWKKGNISLKIIGDKSFMMKLCLYENNKCELRTSEALYERRSSQLLYTTFEVAKRKPAKNLGLYGIWTLDLCDADAALYQLS